MSTTAAPTTTEGVCVFCGGGLRPIHAETGRCQSCGRVVRSPGTEPVAARNGHVGQPTPTPSRPEPFKLPGSPKTRRWVQQAKVLRDGFLAAAEKADASAKAAEHEAQRYRKAALVFSQLLDQLDVEETAQTRPTRKRGAWSAHADACLDCGRSDVPHCAKGYCKHCYDRLKKRVRRAA